MKNSTHGFRAGFLVLALILVALNTGSDSTDAQSNSRRQYENTASEFESFHSQLVLKSYQAAAESRGFELLRVNLSSTLYYLKFHREGPERPAILLIGGLPAAESLSGFALQGFIDLLESDERKALFDAILERADLYIIPDPNGAVRNLNPGDPRVSIGGTVQPRDDDRDGKADEDGPRDINDDLEVHQMRIPRKGGAYVVSEDGRFMLPVKPGETGTHDLLWEGEDDDSDGKVNEDPIGSVSLLNDFAINWDSKRDDAALFPMQQRVTRDIADFLVNHPNICAAIHLRMQEPSLSFAMGPKVRPPAKPADQVWLEKVSKTVGSTIFEKEPKLAAHEHGGGSVLDWIYEVRGAYAFDLNPITMKEPEKTVAEEEEPLAKKPEEDERMHEHQTWMLDSPEMFKPWEAYDHPQLGKVEIGGWNILTGWMPMGDAEKTEKQFGRVMHGVKELARLLPQIAVEKTEAQSLGNDLWRVRLTLTNSGGLPYRPALAQRNRTGLPIVVKQVDDKVTLVSGRRKQFAESIDPGGTASFEWIVKGGSDAELAVDISGQRMQDIAHRIALKDCAELKPERDEATKDAKGGK